MALTAERLDPVRWVLIPITASLGATLLLTAPLRIHGVQLPEPIFAMIPTFAWAVLRPSILSPLCVLALGFCCDRVWGARLGLWELSLLAAFGFVLVTRSMMSGQSRTMLWAWYAAACAVAMATAYLAVVLETHSAPSLLAVAGQWLPTAILYPVADGLIGRFEDADPRFR